MSYSSQRFEFKGEFPSWLKQQDLAYEILSADLEQLQEFSRTVSTIGSIAK